VTPRHPLDRQIQQDVRTINARYGFRRNAKNIGEDATILDHELVRTASLNAFTLLLAVGIDHVRSRWDSRQ